MADSATDRQCSEEIEKCFSWAITCLPRLRRCSKSGKAKEIMAYEQKSPFDVQKSTSQGLDLYYRVEPAEIWESMAGYRSCEGEYFN